MTQARKKILLLLLAVACVCLVLLSSSLSNLQLLPGLPVSVVEAHNVVRSTAPHLERVYSFNFLQAVLGLLLFVLMVYVPARLILFVKAQWIFRLVQILAVLSIVVLFLSFLSFDPGCATSDCAQAGLIPSFDSPVLSVENPPPQILAVIETGLILAVVLFMFWIFSRLYRRPRVDPLLSHAENAVQDIRSGKDFKSVIVQCYLRMADALQQEQGIERNRAMTSREFEALLVSRGLPNRPVHELTRLFENVRYGQDPLSREEELAALDCLNSIIGFVQGKSHG